MERFQNLDKVFAKRIYTRRALFDWIKRYYPKYDDSSCAWILGYLIKRKVLFNIGFDCYVKDGNSLLVESPKSTLAKDLTSLYRKQFQSSDFICFHTADLSKVLDTPQAMDLMVFEVKKENLYPFYLELKSKTKSLVLLNPSRDELSRYYDEGCVLLRPYASKAPLSKGKYLAEKLCVDLTRDSLLEDVYPSMEPIEALRALLETYDMNYRTLLSYAKRRGVSDLVINSIYESVSKEVIETLKKNDKFPKEHEEI